MIKQIMKIPIQKLDNQIFSFKRTKGVALRNSKILSVFSGNFGSAVDAQNGSPLNYGSEFHYISKSSKIFNYHKYKSNIISIIQQGSRCHLSLIDEENRKSDL